MPPVAHASVACPLFSIRLQCSDTELLGLTFTPPESPWTGSNALAREAARQIQAWLDDADLVFDLPLATTGTPFRRRVWAAISAIPRGQTRSYGDLAHALETAPRAVGQACGANPFPLIVPCHRVIARQGGLNDGLGGFDGARQGFLLDIKRWLLAHER